MLSKEVVRELLDRVIEGSNEPVNQGKKINTLHQFKSILIHFFP